MPNISRAKLLAAATTVLVLLLACNLELLPLALLVDTIGLDALALLLSAQLMAQLPWLRAKAPTVLRFVRLAAGALLIGFVGGYLRQLVVGLGQGTVTIGSAQLADRTSRPTNSQLVRNAKGPGNVSNRKFKPLTHTEHSPPRFKY